MLDEELAAETTKLEDAAEKMDTSFRVSQSDWLELRARVTTVARLMRARDPASGELRQFEEAFAPLLK